MNFQYELSIELNAVAELPVMESTGQWRGDDEYDFDSLYYGFHVKDVGFTANNGKKPTDRIYKMEGNSTLEELQSMFTTLTKEVLTSETPTTYFKGGVELLNLLLLHQNPQEFDDGVEYETSRHYPMFGVRLYLHKIPAPVKKDPEPDGCVTGSLWRVTYSLVNKDTDKTVSQEYDTYCIKPESAVHEAFDWLFRACPGILDKYDIVAPVDVRKIRKDTIKIPYIVVEDKKGA